MKLQFEKEERHLDDFPEAKVVTLSEVKEFILSPVKGTLFVYGVIIIGIITMMSQFTVISQ